MTSLTTTCPHCRTQKVAFRVVSVTDNRNKYTGNVFGQCPVCYQPSAFVVKGNYENMAQNMQQYLGQNIDLRATQTGLEIRIQNTYPTIVDHQADESWPIQIKRPFIDILKMFDEHKSPALIIGACRSVLDVVLKDLKGEGKNIHQRVDDLAQKGIVTGVLKDWSHELRERGNEATHDLDDGTPGLDRQLVEFIKLLLHAAYELPERIKKSKLEADHLSAP